MKAMDRRDFPIATTLIDLGWRVLSVIAWFQQLERWAKEKPPETERHWITATSPSVGKRHLG
jgi:hypothetical protein